MAKENARSVNTFEENMKKAFTELLVLHILSERDFYIAELSEAIAERSNGVIAINRPYAVIMRLLESSPPYLTEIKRRENAESRIRQYYSITEQGREYLAELLASYHKYMPAIHAILTSGGNTV